LVNKKENLLVLGMISLCIALTLETVGNNDLIVNLIVLVFIGISIFSGAQYIIRNSLDNKKKKSK
jgi:phosphatidylglycerophosphate synthase